MSFPLIPCNDSHILYTEFGLYDMAFCKCSTASAAFRWLQYETGSRRYGLRDRQQQFKPLHDRHHRKTFCQREKRQRFLPRQFRRQAGRGQKRRNCRQKRRHRRSPNRIARHFLFCCDKCQTRGCQTQTECQCCICRHPFRPAPSCLHMTQGCRGNDRIQSRKA